MKTTVIACLGLSFAASLLATEATNDFPFVPPCRALVAAAIANHFPHLGFDAPMETNALTPGDSATILATQFEKGGRREQWVILLQVVAPTERERASKPAPPRTIYTTIGHKLEFTSARTFVSVRTMGPFEAAGSERNPPRAEDESARIALDTGFLSLGFDRAAAAGHRVAQIGRETKPEGLFSVGDKPFSKAQIAEGQEFAALYHITLEEERAMAGISAALEGFFGLAAQTPALNKILFKIFNVPSPLSLLSKGHLPNVGIMTGLYDATPGDPKNWHLTADAPLYDLPSAVMVNQDPGLYLDTMVTTPYPPFLVTGGVWFCYGKGFDEPGRLRHFDQGLELLEAIHCPLIVGDIPDVSAAANGILSTDELPSSKTLATANRRLKEWTAKHRAVVVVPLAKFIKTAMADQALAVHDSILPAGKTRALIQNDKLHPTARGCAVLALAILDAFQTNQSGVGERDVRWNVETVLDTALESSQREATGTGAQ